MRLPDMTPAGAKAIIALTDRPEFGEEVLLAALETIDLYEKVLALERPWLGEIPPEYRAADTWTYAELDWRRSELELARGERD